MLLLWMSLNESNAENSKQLHFNLKEADGVSQVSPYTYSPKLEIQLYPEEISGRTSQSINDLYINGHAVNSICWHNVQTNFQSI